MNTDRFKNPYFWLGLIGVIFTAMGLEPSMLTSWDLVVESFKTLINNPFMLGSVAVAILGVFIEPTTKGIKDEIK